MNVDKEKNIIKLTIDTGEAEKQLDKLIEKATQLKAILAECRLPADNKTK